MSDRKIYKLADGEVSLWIEDGGSIHLKAVSPFGDPTELTEEMARELGLLLMTLAEEIDPAPDDLKLEESFQRTQAQLIEAARRAQQEIAEGKAKPMD
jgi:hypothetical protein